MFRLFPLPKENLQGTLLTFLATQKLQEVAKINHELRTLCKEEFIRRQKIFHLIKHRIAVGDLSATQISHFTARLKSTELVDEIARNGIEEYKSKEKIEQIIAKNAPDKLIGLEVNRFEGVAAGLTREQVEPPWFQAEHVKFIKKHGVESFPQIATLHFIKVLGVNLGLTRAQVEMPEFGTTQLNFLEKHGIKYFPQIINLNWMQIRDLEKKIKMEDEQSSSKSWECLIL